MLLSQRARAGAQAGSYTADTRVASSACRLSRPFSDRTPEQSGPSLTCCTGTGGWVGFHLDSGQPAAVTKRNQLK